MSLLRATRFEFRNRFWMIGAIFLTGFALSFVDRVNAGVAVVRWLAPAGFQVSSPRGLLALRSVYAFGALLCLAAAALRTWAAAYLESSVVHDARLRADRVVADGPYRFVRNPLYLGTALLATGMAVLASRLGFVWIVVGMLFLTFRLIGREEAELTAVQRASYAAYRAAVPRLLPALRPRLPAGGTTPHWRQAFFGEIFVWSFALAVVAFVPTFDQRLFFFFLSVGLLATFLFKLRQRSTGG